MMRGASTLDWVERMGALTVERDAAGPGGDVATAEAAVARLAGAAWQAVAGGALPGSCEAPHGCLPDGDRLADGCPGRLACDLAGDLAAAFFGQSDLPASRGPAGAQSPVTAVERRRRYLAALREVGPAVSTCRRVLHAGGRCLFRPSPAGPSDLCARVLAAAHEAGFSARQD